MEKRAIVTYRKLLLEPLVDLFLYLETRLPVPPYKVNSSFNVNTAVRRIQ